LKPLSQDHAIDLRVAVADGELWKLWYTSVPAPEEVSGEIDRRLKLQSEGSMIPFVIIDKASEKAVGMTSYMNIDRAMKRLEIGSTWYAQSVQRTAINTECKLMLLSHAFDQLNCVAVEFRTAFFNHQSRSAIERLGAKLDGILRNHRRHKNGTLHDTCVYSIIAGEWPVVKANLQFKLEKHVSALL
jgi:RimJ/RimL family protein N-acetyltransferase